METDKEAQKLSHIYSHQYEGVVSVEFCREMEKQRDEAFTLLRRLGTPKAFMDLEGVRIICSDFMAKRDATSESKRKAAGTADEKPDGQAENAGAFPPGTPERSLA